MREHEVPTHVQAEDKVLLWLTFPQVVAVTAVCAIAYGAYRYAPVGPAEVRLGLAVAVGVVGMAMVVGRIGGRKLPLVAADLLKYWLGARRYAGTAAELGRNEPPPRPAREPGRLLLMARRLKSRRLRRRRGRARPGTEKRNGRRPFKPHGWFRRNRMRKEGGQDPGRRRATRRMTRTRRRALLAALLTVAVATVPQAALAGGDTQGLDGLGFDFPEPVPGGGSSWRDWRSPGTGRT